MASRFAAVTIKQISQILNRESCSRENTKKATKFVLEAFTGELNPKTAFFKKKIDPDPMFY